MICSILFYAGIIIELFGVGRLWWNLSLQSTTVYHDEVLEKKIQIDAVIAMAGIIIVLVSEMWLSMS